MTAVVGGDRVGQRFRQHFVHLLHRHKVQCLPARSGRSPPSPCWFSAGMMTVWMPLRIGGHGLLLQPADGQHPAPQGHFSGHGHVSLAPARPVRAETMAVVMVDAGGGAVLGHGALWEMDVNVLVLIKLRVDAQLHWLRERI